MPTRARNGGEAWGECAAGVSGAIGTIWDMGAIVWLIVALCLAVLELFAGELTFLMLAGGALSAAGVSAAFGPSTLWSVVVFTLVSVALLGLLRPVVRRRLLQTPALDTSQSAAIGQHAQVIEDVSATGGLVRFDGSIWSARTMHGQDQYEPGEQVTVVAIDGATAVVWKE